MPTQAHIREICLAIFHMPMASMSHKQVKELGAMDLILTVYSSLLQGEPMKHINKFTKEVLGFIYILLTDRQLILLMALLVAVMLLAKLTSIM